MIVVNPENSYPNLNKNYEVFTILMYSLLYQTGFSDQFKRPTKIYTHYVCLKF